MIKPVPRFQLSTVTPPMIADGKPCPAVLVFEGENIAITLEELTQLAKDANRCLSNVQNEAKDALRRENSKPKPLQAGRSGMPRFSIDLESFKMPPIDYSLMERQLSKLFDPRPYRALTWGDLGGVAASKFKVGDLVEFAPLSGFPAMLGQKLRIVELKPRIQGSPPGKLCRCENVDGTPLINPNIHDQFLMLSKPELSAPKFKVGDRVELKTDAHWLGGLGARKLEVVGVDPRSEMRRNQIGVLPGYRVQAADGKPISPDFFDESFLMLSPPALALKPGDRVRVKNTGKKGLEYWDNEIVKVVSTTTTELGVICERERDRSHGMLMLNELEPIPTTLEMLKSYCATVKP